MKRQISKKLTQTFRIAKIDLILILVPALLWFGATSSRSLVISPPCAKAPQTCSKESVFPMDRLSIGMEDSLADQYSYLTQNFSGVLAVSVPTVWNVALLGAGVLNPVAALAAWGAEVSIVAQAAAWNGLFTEVSHLISQRPRPFVYMDPANRGIDPAHYTSFYSGHTSFTAAMNTAIFLILVIRGAPLILVLLSAVSGFSLIFATAYFRVLAGRHFLTDVICGGMAGITVSYFILRYHRLRSELALPKFMN